MVVFLKKKFANTETVILTVNRVLNTYRGKAVVLRTPKLGVLRISVEWGAADGKQ